MFFLFLESIGTTELLVIMVVALVVFGPRRLPELGRTIGRSLAEFRRASEDFKRTWEMEVEAEQHEQKSAARVEPSIAPPSHETIARASPATLNEIEARGGDEPGIVHAATPPPQISPVPAEDVLAPNGKRPPELIKNNL